MTCAATAGKNTMATIWRHKRRRVMRVATSSIMRRLVVVSLMLLVTTRAVTVTVLAVPMVTLLMR